MAKGSWYWERREWLPYVRKIRTKWQISDHLPRNVIEPKENSSKQMMEMETEMPNKKKETKATLGPKKQPKRKPIERSLVISSYSEAKNTHQWRSSGIRGVGKHGERKKESLPAKTNCWFSMKKSCLQLNGGIAIYWFNNGLMSGLGRGILMAQDNLTAVTTFGNLSGSSCRQSDYQASRRILD